MKPKKKTSAFAGKVAGNAQKQKDSKGTVGYLKLPKGVKLYSPTPDAKEKFDILPYTVTFDKHPDRNDEIGLATPGELWYKRPFKVHRQIGSDNESIICLTSFGKKCPICEYRKQRAKENADKDELKSLNAVQRNLYLVIPRGIKKLEEEIHVFDSSQFLFQDLLNEEILENDDNENFPDLADGKTLKVRWEKGTFAGNSFAEAGRIDFIERDEPIEIDLDEIPDLDSMLIEMSYDKLSALFFEADDDEDDDEKPTKKINEKIREKSKKKEPVKLTWEDIVDMDASELNEVIEANDLEIDIDEYDDIDELRIEIASELNIKKPGKKSEKLIKKDTDDEEDDDEEDDDEEDDDEDE